MKKMKFVFSTAPSMAKRAWRTFGNSSRAIIALATASMAFSALAEMPRLDSSNFDFKYEMESLPSEEDLDNNGAYDFTKSLGSGTSISISSGFASFDGRQGNCFIDSSDVDGSWQRYGITAQTGFTIEARILARFHTGGDYVCALTASVPDSNVHALLNFSTDKVLWGSNVLTNMDMSADFHTWRIARAAGASDYYVWCDGNLVGKNLGVPQGTESWGTLNRLTFGTIGWMWRGATWVSYLRFTKGGYAPRRDRKDSGDFAHKYEMSSDDSRFSATATTADWTLAKSDGTASLSGGVLSATVPRETLRYWTSVPMDSSIVDSSPFTFETRLRVHDAWDSAGRVLFLRCGTPREYAYFIIATNSVRWVDSANHDNVIHTGDNSDKMHVFRIAFTGDGDTSAGGFMLWRDGEMVSENIKANVVGNDGNCVLFGVGSRAYGGAFDIDYIRWTTDGVYAPPGPGFTIVIK